jgi:hypothetical protein
MLRDVVFIAVGVVVIIFHRPIARWQRTGLKALDVGPFRLIPRPPLLCYIVPLLLFGIGFLLMGVLSLAGVVHWRFP